MTILFSKKNVNTFLIIVFTLLPYILLSQETEMPWYNSVSIPPSPNSSALGVYGEIPVTKATGIPSINIPILNISEGGIDVPISLSYNASGIKVQQQATTVGLGWVLNAGGVITRTVNGRPDDGGFLSTISNMPTYATVLSSFSGTDTKYQNEVLSWLDDVTENRHDYEPDVFYYNFGNKSGYFMFGNHGLPVLFPHSDIKIEPFWKDPRTLGGFMVQDTDGKLYVFGDLEVDSTNYIEKTTTISDGFSDSFISSWVLNKIINKTTQSEIKFSYHDATIGDQINASSSCQYMEYMNGQTFLEGPNCSENIVDNTITAKHIKNIHTEAGDINFYYKNLNTELEYIVFNSRKFLFDYSSFQEVIPSGGVSELGRLKLNSIVEFVINTSDSLKYKFEYEAGALPSTNSFAVDFWGYYNGANSNTTFVPTTEYRGQLLPNADRDPKHIFTKRGVLNKITYPTGGWSQFIFENNTIKVNEAGISRIDSAGGLRIKQIINHDPLTNNKNYTTYEYDNGSFTSTNTAITNSAFTVRDSTHTGTIIDRTYITFNSSAGSSLGASSNVVSYGKVTEYKGEPQNNIGKIETYYDNSKRESKSQMPPYFFSISYQYLRGNPIEENIYNDLGKIKSTKYVYENDNNHSYSIKSFKASRIRQNLSHDPRINFRECFILANAIYESESKRLSNTITSEYLFSSQSNLSDTITLDVKYYYENNSHLNVTRTESIMPDGKLHTTIFKYPLDAVSCENNCRNEYLLDVDSCNRNFLPNGKILETCESIYKPCISSMRVSIHDLETSLIKSMVSSNGQIVDSADVNNYKEIMKDYDTCLLSSLQTLAQLNCNLTKCAKNSYVSFTDCEINYKKCLVDSCIKGADSIKSVALLALMNINNKPIETIKYVDRILVEHTKMDYDRILMPADSGYVPVAKEASIKTSGPTFIPLMIYKNYDKNLNISEISSKVNSASTSYTWGYKNKYLIAEVKNATINETGFSSFESNESNGWSTYPENQYDNTYAFSGKSSMKVSSIYGPTTSFNVGSEAMKHSGYQASVWVNGSRTAYLHIEVEGLWDTRHRVSNPSTSGWNLLKVELPSQILLSNPGKNVKVYVGTESGTAYFDDLRFHPSDAQMTTYTHEPLIGITSSSDANNRKTTYEYDGFGRLKLVKDYLGNILKKYDYNYKTTL